VTVVAAVATPVYLQTTVTAANASHVQRRNAWNLTSEEYVRV
jgi:hypothetical protein